jgi:hypothetical protein
VLTNSTISTQTIAHDPISTLIASNQTFHLFGVPEPVHASFAQAGSGSVGFTLEANEPAEFSGPGTLSLSIGMLAPYIGFISYFIQEDGFISPVLANIYLHKVLDQWFEQQIRAVGRGQAMINRYADDFICAFENKQEAQEFLKKLESRLAEYGLELAADKTRLLRFSRFEVTDNESFEYLGFEFRWGRALNGKAVVKRRTARKKLRASVASFTEWIKEQQHSGTPWVMRAMVAKLRGHWNYYGVIGNQASQWEFFRQITGILFKWINRRSQRTSYTWAGLADLFKQYAVPKPCITEPANG